MITLYRLEAYHWDKDYWSIISEFSTKKDAEKMQHTLEKQYPLLTFSIFHKEVYYPIEKQS